MCGIVLKCIFYYLKKVHVNVKSVHTTGLLHEKCPVLAEIKA